MVFFFFFFHQGVSLFFLFFFLLFLFSLPLLLLQLHSVDCSAAHGPPPLPFHNLMMKNIYVAQEKKKINTVLCLIIDQQKC